MVDDENLDRTLGRCELQPELSLQRGEEAHPTVAALYSPSLVLADRAFRRTASARPTSPRPGG